MNEMPVSNFLKKIIFPAFLAVAIYLYNCHIGKHGIYLFDFSIIYHMGWLIFNGWIPFVDFKMPLMPLSGILVALSFCLFGVKYYSAVKLAGIICAISFILMGHKLKKYLGYFFGYTASALIILATIPIHGTLYYNHLSMLLFSIYLVLILDYILDYKNFSGKKETTSSLVIFFFIALILLNKFHIGMLSGLFFVGLESYLFLKEKTLRNIVPSLAIRILPLIILLSILLIWINFNIADLIDNLFHSTKLDAYFDADSLIKKIGASNNDNVSSFFQIKTYLVLLFSIMGANNNDNVFSLPQINIYLVVLFSMGLVFYHLRFCKKNVVANKILYFITVAPLIQMLSFFSSAEALTINIPFIMVWLVALYIYICKTLDIKNNIEIKKVKFICAIFTGTLFLVCAIFMVYYSCEYLRKSYDENKAVFLSKDLVLINKYTPENHFFNQIKMNYEQKKNFDYLNKVVNEYRLEKVFFGPELEMFYAATEALPSKQFPLWMHKDVSYNSDNHPQMRKIFIDQNYDVIILSKNRYGFTDFVNDYIESKYTELKSTDSDIWIRVFVKKN